LLILCGIAARNFKITAARMRNHLSLRMVMPEQKKARYE
jgi:hypothetical protein